MMIVKISTNISFIVKILYSSCLKAIVIRSIMPFIYSTVTCTDLKGLAFSRFNNVWSYVSSEVAYLLQQGGDKSFSRALSLAGCEPSLQIRTRKETRYVVCGKVMFLVLFVCHSVDGRILK